jgi:molybdenum cofactor guanylyltransferase
MTPPPCTAIIVTGGKNTRMGGHLKAFLELDGRTFMDHILDVLKPRCREFIFVAKDPSPYAQWPDIPTISDQFDIQSPLAGIHAGLVHMKTEHAICTGCDMPLVRGDIVDILMDAIEPEVDIVVPYSGVHFQPLCAIYSKNCIPAIEKQLRRGGVKVDHFFKQVRLKKIPYERFEAVDPDLVSFFNINTPEDLDHARQLIQSR